MTFTHRLLGHLVLVGSLVTLAASQSPLTTTFVSDNSGPPGGNVYFNLTVNVPGGVTIQGLDVNLASAVGTRGQIELWAKAGTHVGFETNASVWTRVGTAQCRAAGLDAPTRCVFAAPVTLQAGLNGIALCGVGVAHAFTNGNGANQNYSNAELTLRAGATLESCFGAGTPVAGRVANVTIYHGSESLAAIAVVGTGCGSTGATSFYENFPPGGFDLDGGGFCATPNNLGGYNVSPTTGSIVTPTSGGLSLGDNALSTQTVTPCSRIGGMTSTIQICSNGFVQLDGAATTPDASPTVAELLSSGPRIAVFWTDLVPDGGTNVNNVYFETVGSASRITWWNVAVAGNPNCRITAQLTITPVGTGPSLCQFCVLYRVNCTGTLPAVIVGMSPGANNLDPGNRDLSGGSFQTQNDVYPIGQDSLAPRIGTIVTVETNRIPAGSPFGALLIGSLTQPPIDLTPFGAPTCFLYLNIAVSLGFPIAGSTATVPLAIPNAPSLLGAQISTQSAVIAQGLNTLGIGTSNALQWTFGNL